ncbi:hypothetical protein GQR58_007928 [Nymphon striatum]|nr:hypothetical protein GQR58_007928 [Nymphon striatum]
MKILYGISSFLSLQDSLPTGFHYHMCSHQAVDKGYETEFRIGIGTEDGAQTRLKQYQDTATLDKMTEDGPASPYIASQGNPLNLTADYFIILENECIIRTNKLTDALILTFMLFYVFCLEYPKRVCSTLKYIQTIVFQRNATEEGNMPSKLLRLINTIHN